MVWILDNIDWKSEVSSGVGSVLRRIMFAIFGASLIWVSVTIISFWSSWIQVFVSFDRFCWLDSELVGCSSSVTFFGVSISYNSLSLVSVERISTLFGGGFMLRLLIISFRFVVVSFKLWSTSSFGITYSLCAEWSVSGVWLVRIFFIIFVKLYIVYPSSCCFSLIASARSSLPIMSESSPSGSFFPKAHGSASACCTLELLECAFFCCRSASACALESSLPSVPCEEVSVVGHLGFENFQCCC